MKNLPKFRSWMLSVLIAGAFCTAPAFATTYVFKSFSPGVVAPILTPIWAVSGSPVTTFADTTQGSTAAVSVSITLKNTGVLGSYTSAAMTGTNASDFAQSNNCSSVPAGGTCALSVKFKPSLVGAESASLLVAGSTLSLTGNGTAPLYTYTNAGFTWTLLSTTAAPFSATACAGTLNGSTGWRLPTATELIGSLRYSAAYNYPDSNYWNTTYNYGGYNEINRHSTTLSTSWDDASNNFYTVCMKPV